MSSLVVETSPVSWAWPYLQLYDHHANFNWKNTVCLPCLPINSMLYRTRHVWLFTAKFYGMNNILFVRLKNSTVQKFPQLKSRIWSSDLECFNFLEGLLRTWLAFPSYILILQFMRWEYNQKVQSYNTNRIKY